MTHLTTALTDEQFLEGISVAIRDEMIKAAEPLIQEALRTSEIEMRKRLAEMVVGLIQSSYDLECDRRRMVISVKLGEVTRSSTQHEGEKRG